MFEMELLVWGLLIVFKYIPRDPFIFQRCYHTLETYLAARGMNGLTTNFVSIITLDVLYLFGASENIYFYSR